MWGENVHLLSHEVLEFALWRPAAWLHQADELIDVRWGEHGFFCQLLLRAFLVPAPAVQPRVSDLVKS